MDAVTLLIAASLAAGLVIIVRSLRGRKRADPASRIDFDMHKNREMGTRGLAGRP